MSNYLKVYMPLATRTEIKKRAFSEGKSQSEIAKEMIEYAINNRFDAGSVTPRAAVMDVLKAVRILKNLKLDEIEDIDKIEGREMTTEETAQMLKKMGID